MATDPERVRDLYRRAARGYDLRTAIAAPLRHRAIDRLALSPGDAILDVACGTGVNLPPLAERVGREGRVVGVDLSPDMLGRARERVAREGLPNVSLIESAVEEAELPGPFDAALISLSHDILQSPPALRNVLAQLRPGGRIATFAVKRGPRWLAPINAIGEQALRRYVTRPENLDRPWQRLAELVPALEVEELLLGFVYLAWGRSVREPE